MIKREQVLRAYDLCAGVGGFRVGASQALGDGIEFVGWCEFDPYVQRSYRAMYSPNGDSHIEDLTCVTRLPGEVGGQPIQMGSVERNDRIRGELPSMDLLLAGFPCQPHSLMGKRRGKSDSRGELFYDIAAVIDAMRPKHFVLENVRGMKSVNDGRYFRDILDTLRERLGYYVTILELNAADYGVPQVRRRVFLIGSEDEKDVGTPPTVQPEERHYQSTWHLLDRRVDERYYLSERILRTILKHQHKGYSRKAEINRLDARPLCRTMHKMHRASQDNYYSDAFINGQFMADGTVRLASDGESRIRRVTPREAFRIQSFPEDLIDLVVASGNSDTRLYMQAGNAVPPSLASAVVREIFIPDHMEAPK